MVDNSPSRRRSVVTETRILRRAASLARLKVFAHVRTRTIKSAAMTERRVARTTIECASAKLNL